MSREVNKLFPCASTEETILGIYLFVQDVLKWLIFTIFKVFEDLLDLLLGHEEANIDIYVFKQKLDECSFASNRFFTFIQDEFHGRQSEQGHLIWLVKFVDVLRGEIR